jgi:hypothetical protein
MPAADPCLDSGGEEPPIRAVIQVRLAARCDSDSAADPLIPTQQCGTVRNEFRGFVVVLLCGDREGQKRAPPASGVRVSR